MSTQLGFIHYFIIMLQWMLVHGGLACLDCAEIESSKNNITERKQETKLGVRGKEEPVLLPLYEHYVQHESHHPPLPLRHCPIGPSAFPPQAASLTEHGPNPIAQM